MKSFLQPWQLLLLILSGWINRREQDVIECFRAENRVLREKLGKRRILFDDDQPRRLAGFLKAAARRQRTPGRTGRGDSFATFARYV
jgi:hypothetical protein